MNIKLATRLSAIAAISTLALSACSSNGDDTNSGDTGTEDTAAEETETEDADAEASGDAPEAISVGISQFAEHPALDGARDGFIQALADAGYVEGENLEIELVSAQGEVDIAATAAQSLAGGGHDLILGIATPSAQALASEITDIPVLFTAVTEPAVAGIVDDWEVPGGNITGTSDLNDVDAQLRLIQEIIPDVETIGIVYSSGEVNSEVQIALAEETAAEIGVELQLATATASNEVATSLETMTGVDAIYVPTDNLVVDTLDTVIGFGESNQIPVFAAEGDSVENGAIATWGSDYFELGYQTGEMALRILEGADPANTPVEILSESQLILNTAAAERFGVTLNDDLLSRADEVFEN